MLVEKIEHRILVGITMFVGIMLLVGWVAINENARMQSFTQQYDARSVERGAQLYSQYCTTCHGRDGRGLVGAAPALNSPHFFSYDPLAGVNRELETLTEQEEALNNELIELATEMVNPETSAERSEEIDARIAEINILVNGEEGITVRRAALITEREDLIAALQPAIDRGYPLEVNLETGEITRYAPSRLSDAGWEGTRDDYVETTLIHGRPGSGANWPQQMVSFSSRGTGSLRDDQIRDLVAYVLAWDQGEDWTLDDFLAVQQYHPGRFGGPAAEGAEPAGTDVVALTEQVSTLVGDPVRGAAIYNNERTSQLGSRLGCSGCHGAGNAPATTETWDATLSIRLEEPQFENYTPEQYIIESIVLPGAYSVPGNWPVVMPMNFGERMSAQDIADVVAYLHTYSEIDPYVAPEPGAESTAEAEETIAEEGEQIEATPNIEVTPESEATPEATPSTGG
jgi:mono/diheme cytochrome c family protein